MSEQRNNAGTGPLNWTSSNNAAKSNNNAAAGSGSAGGGGWWASVKDSFSSAGSKVNNMLGDKQTTIAFMVLTFVAIIAIIIYIVYKIRNKNLQSVVLLETPLKLFDMEETPVKFSSDKIAPTSNGQEYTYSFWLYLVDYDIVSDQHRLIFVRNPDADVEAANPVVFMDGRTNRLYVSARTNKSQNVDDLSELVPEKSAQNNYLTAVVEYIPLQRWVHISIVMQDNLMTVFKDGDMYTVKNVHDLWNSNEDDERPFFRSTRGHVFVGNMSGNNTPTYGFISRLMFHNYALMEKDVQEVYGQGPTSKGILSRMGMGNYGVRTPVYKKD